MLIARQNHHSNKGTLIFRRFWVVDNRCLDGDSVYFNLFGLQLASPREVDLHQFDTSGSFAFVISDDDLFKVVEKGPILHVGDVLGIDGQLGETKQMIRLLNGFLEHQLLILDNLQKHRVFAFVTYLSGVATLELAVCFFVK